MLGKSKKNEPSDLEKKIQFCRQYAKIWADLFNYFSDKLDDASVTPQRDDEFFKIMSVLASRHFELTARLGDDLKDADKITDLLGKLVGLANLQNMSEVEFSTTQVAWHEIFIGLNKALGRLVQQLPAPVEGKAKPAQAATTAA